MSRTPDAGRALEGVLRRHERAGEQRLDDPGDALPAAPRSGDAQPPELVDPRWLNVPGRSVASPLRFGHDPSGAAAPGDSPGRRAHELDRAHVFLLVGAGGAEPDGRGRSERELALGRSRQRYLDFSSQLVFTNIGHQHPRVVEAIAEQAWLLCTIAPQHANAARSEVARLVARHLPSDRLNKVFFTNRGRGDDRRNGRRGRRGQR